VETIDDLLMRQVAEGSDSAFETLTRRHMRRALVLAQGVLGNPTDADEIAQEAFLRVWAHADRWVPGKARFSTWLHRIVLNLCLDRRRRPQWVGIEVAGDVADERHPSAFDFFARKEREAVIGKALDTVPPRQRAALALFYFEGMSGKNAAEVLGISVPAFEQLLLRARRALKAGLAKAGIDFREMSE
jgi:RNA polymerase sigma-70 factor (ECF subfamily)